MATNHLIHATSLCKFCKFNESKLYCSILYIKNTEGEKRLTKPILTLGIASFQNMSTTPGLFNQNKF